MEDQLHNEEQWRAVHKFRDGKRNRLALENEAKVHTGMKVRDVLSGRWQPYISPFRSNVIPKPRYY